MISDLVHRAVMQLAAANDGSIGAGVRDTHWAPETFAKALAGYARRLYDAPTDRLTLSHLIDGDDGARNHANTAFGPPELRRILPVAGVLALDEGVLGKPDSLVVKTFESSRQTDSWQSPHHHAPRSVFAFPDEAEAGSTSGRCAYVLLLIMTRTGQLLPIACVPLLSPNWDPEHLDRRARARGRRDGLEGVDLERYVDDILSGWRAQALELGGRHLPFAAHEIATELLDELELAERAVHGECELTKLPAIGGWLTSGMSEIAGRRARLLGHSLEALEAHESRGSVPIFDLVSPQSIVGTPILGELPWEFELDDGKRISGAGLVDALDDDDDRVWRLVPPLLTPGEPGDDYWFVARGTACDGHRRLRVTLLAHRRLHGSDAATADAPPFSQIRVTTDACDDDKALGRMLRLSLVDSAIHRDGTMDRLRASIARFGALDVQARKLVGENLTALGLTTAALSASVE